MQRHIHEETSGVRERTKRRGYEAMHCSLVIAHCPGTVLCMQKLCGEYLLLLLRLLLGLLHDLERALPHLPHLHLQPGRA